MALGVSGPLQEDVAEAALEVVVLVLIAHQGHDLTPLRHCIIELDIRLASLLDQICLLFFKLRCVAATYELCIAHLILNLGDLLLRLVDVGERLPVLHHLEEVLLVLVPPVVQCSSDELLLVIVLDGPSFPDLERSRRTLVVCSGEAV